MAASGTLPPVVATLTADIKQFSAKMAEAKGEMDELAKKGESSGSRLASLGGNIAKGLVVGAAGLGGVAIKMAGDFQESMTQLVTGAGESEKQIGSVSSGILNMAGQVGESTKQLASGMYMIESAGYHGADGLKVLKAAAEGAKVGNADLGVVSNALTSILNAYHLPASQAVAVTNELVATVGAGKMHMEDLASAISTVLPVANAVGISFDQVGGALATMTSQGVSAQEGTQQLVNIIKSLSAPTAAQTAAMAQFGLSAHDLSANLSKAGLTGSLDQVYEAIMSRMGPSGQVLLNTFKTSKQATADLQTELAAMPPNLRKVEQAFLDGSLTGKAYKAAIKALPADQANLAAGFQSTYNAANGFSKQMASGAASSESLKAALTQVLGTSISTNAALELTGNHMDTFKTNVAAVGTAAHAAGSSVQGWNLVQKDFNFKLDQAKATAEAMAIKIGTHLIPVVEHMAHAILDATKWLEQHKAVAEGLAVVIGGALSVAVGAFVVNKVAGFVRGVSDAVNATRNFMSAVAALASRIAAGMGLEQQSAQLGALSAALSTNTAETEANTAATEANAASHEADTAAVESSVAPMAASEAAAGGLAGELGGAGVAAGGLTEGLGGAGLLGVLGPAAVGVGLVGGAIYLMSRHSSDGTVSTKTFTQALANVGTQSTQTAAQVEAATIANSKLGKSISDNGANLGNYTRFLQSSGNEARQLADGLAHMGQVTDKYSDDVDTMLRKTAAGGNQLAAALLADEKAGNLTGNQVKALIKTLDNAKTSTDDSSAADRRKQQALNGVKLSTDQVVQSLQRQIAAQQDGQNATDQFNGALDQAKSDNLAVTQAQNDLNDAINQYGPSSTQAQQAALALSAAQRQVHGDFVNVSNAVLSQIGYFANHDSSSEQFVSHQQSMIATLKANQAQMGLTDDQLKLLIADILAVPPGKNVIINTNAGQVINQIQQLSTDIANIPTGKQLQLNRGYAMGTDDLPEGMSVVGEDGPEVINKQGNRVSIYSNSSTPGGLQMPSVSGGGVSLLDATTTAPAGGPSGNITVVAQININGRKFMEAVLPDMQTAMLQAQRVGMKFSPN